MSAPRRVRIGRLVLDGVAPQQRAAVVASFEAELSRLLTAYPDRLPDRTAPRAGAQADSDAEIGRRAAAAVHARVVAAC